MGDDGQHHYFEVLLVDPSAPTIQADKDWKWIRNKQHRNRAERGLTSTQKKSRGLRKKGEGAEKIPGRAGLSNSGRDPFLEKWIGVH